MQRPALLALAVLAIVTGCEKDTRTDRTPTEPDPTMVMRLTFESDGAPDQVVEVLRRRLATLDDIEVDVRGDGELVVVDLGPAPEDTYDGVRRLITRPGGFALHAVEPDGPLLDALAQRASGDIRAETEVWYGGQSSITARYLLGPDQATLATFVGQALSELDLDLPADQVLLYGPVDTAPDARRDPPPWRTYLAARQPALTSADVRDAQVTTSPYSNQPEVVVTFADRDRLHQVTRERVGRKLAIVVDGHVKMAPIVNEPVPGGRISITLGTADPDTMKREARDLALVLRSALPAPLRHLSTSHIGGP
jgi:preprotein translocase subunit SecD